MRQRIDQPSRRRRAVTSAIAAMLAFGVLAQPATAAETGSVAADVTLQAASACIELSETAVSFGSLGFAAEAAPASPNITITNCSTVEIELHASATDATSPDASWALVDDDSTCGGSPDLGTDQYRLGLDGPAFADGPATLATLNQTVGGLDVGAATTHTPLIWTPCPGSSGDDQTLMLEITYLAVIEE